MNAFGVEGIWDGDLAEECRKEQLQPIADDYFTVPLSANEERIQIMNGSRWTNSKL